MSKQRNALCTGNLLKLVAYTAHIHRTHTHAEYTHTLFEGTVVVILPPVGATFLPNMLIERSYMIYLKLNFSIIVPIIMFARVFYNYSLYAKIELIIINLQVRIGKLFRND